MGGDDDTLLLLLSTITSTLFGLEMKRQCKHGTNVYGFYGHVTASSRGKAIEMKDDNE